MIDLLATLLPLGAPALPLDEAGKYVAGAYVVFVLLLVVYLAIMGAKVSRIERELRELAGFAENRAKAEEPAPAAAPEAASVSAPLASRGAEEAARK